MKIAFTNISYISDYFTTLIKGSLWRLKCWEFSRWWVRCLVDRINHDLIKLDVGKIGEDYKKICPHISRSVIEDLHSLLN
jgi:hypothetical protein